MNQQQRDDIKKLIAKKIIRAEKRVKSYQSMTKPIAPENSIGRLSRMDAINNKGVAEAALYKAEQTLKDLRYMLNKVDDENFGICARCKKTIPIGRLVLMPESKHCVHCAK